MKGAKLLGLIGAGLAMNELAKGSGSRSANARGDVVNGDVVDLLIQRIKTDAKLQSILRGPASGASVRAELEILGQWTEVQIVADNYNNKADHYFYILIGEIAGGVTDGTDVFVKLDISQFYLKDDENLHIERPYPWEDSIISISKNPDGTPFSGDAFSSLAPSDAFDWTYVGRAANILTYKLGGLRKKNGFGPFMRSAFRLRMLSDTQLQSFPTESYSIGVEVSGGGMAEPVTGSIVVPPAFYLPLE